MKIRIMRVIPLLVCFLFAVSVIQPVAATVVWSDNFNDGDYNGWTVEESAWLIDNFALQHDGTVLVRGIIWHPSSQVVGTWSFDISHEAIVTGDNYHRLFVNFMINETSGYGIRISEMGVYFQRIDDGVPSALNFTVVDDLLHTWTHYDVTRDATGKFHVFVNATSTTAVPDISVTDTTYTLSEKFEIIDEASFLHSSGVSFTIDNITVDDEIKITPPEPTTTPTDTEAPTGPGDGEPFPLDPMLLAVVGGVIVVLLVIVLMMKRR